MIPLFTFARKLLREYGKWGRLDDRTSDITQPPLYNPDAIDEGSQGDRPFKVSKNPFVKAGLRFRDIGRLWVSAQGVEPDVGGAYAPPQLVYPPNTSNPDVQILETLAYQYDTQFVRGFGSVLSKHQQVIMQFGRSIAEIGWYRGTEGEYAGKVFAHDIFSRDPEEYFINPARHAPGIYKKNSVNSTVESDDITKMPEGKFFCITYDSLFENPYGQSITSLLTTMTETWNRVYDAWRVGLMHAGYGAILGSYGPELKDDTTAGRKKKEEFTKQLKKIANGTISIKDADNIVEVLDIKMEADAFLQFHEAYVQAVSILVTGSSTALSEGKYGTYTAKESTDIRQKSEIEQEDAMLLGGAFSFEFNRRFCDFNFRNVQTYPVLQIIQPELIMPTTPEKQKTQMSVIGQAQSGQPYVNQYSQPKPQDEAAEFQADTELPPLRGFPSEVAPPPQWDRFSHDAGVFVKNLTTYGKPYDDLSFEEKRNGFTVRKLQVLRHGETAIRALRDAIADTMRHGVEAEAWDVYWPKARGILQQYNVTMSENELMPSFRYARQIGFAKAVEHYVENHADEIYAIRYKTQDDDRVRYEHKRFHDVVRPANDPIWGTLQTPLDFGCRCYREIIFQDDAEKPEFTPLNDIPEPREQWDAPVDAEENA